MELRTHGSPSPDKKILPLKNNLSDFCIKCKKIFALYPKILTELISLRGRKLSGLRSHGFTEVRKTASPDLRSHESKDLRKPSGRI